jgi:RNA polymerase sigma-70 factor (ECF subfamily)
MHEALQECLRRVVRNVRLFDDEEVFWSWLTVLARSALSDHGRKRRRYFAFLVRFAQQAEFNVPSTVVGDDRVAEALDRAVGDLDTDDQILVRMKYFEQIPVREIAGQLNSTESAIESRLVRIRRKLKSGIAAEMSHEPIE